jgi:hypothetical protein
MSVWMGGGGERVRKVSLASLVAISGPKKVSIFRAQPFQRPALVMDAAHTKIITSRAIYTSVVEP